MIELSIFALIFFIFWTFIGYPLFLSTISIIYNKKSDINEDYTPEVTVLIPTYNEENVIAKKIENIFGQDYPRENLEVIIIDGSSNDKTTKIIKEYISKNIAIKLIEQEKRMGKASAINAGIKECHSDVVIVTDANAIMAKDAIKHAVKHFSDKNIGGVEGRYLTYSRNVGIGEGESSFRKLDAWMKEKESQISSNLSMVGEFSAFRREVITDVSEKAIAEDFEMSLNIIRKGLRIIHEPKAIIYEQPASNVKEEVIQKKRRIIGVIQALIKYKYMLFNPFYGLYGLIILPSHRLFQVLNPFFFILVFISSIIMYISTNANFWEYFVFMELTVIALSFFSLVLLQSRPKTNFKPAVALNYFSLMQVIVFLAWWDYLKGNYKITWEKIESTRACGE